MPRLKINADERSYPPAPAIGTAAELPGSARLKVVRDAKVFALVKGLRRGIEVQSPAFENDRFNAPLLEFERKRNPCNATANDAYRGIQDRTRWKFSGVNKHGVKARIEQSLKQY
ncbi:hypothetical protein [uncultured Phyllobacterium sp.]|uniref:hypothetical protein n=1 Tax=uncultured Phyllobacterium sp. TaxID=253813 RepID=UPI00338D9E01